MESRQGSSDRAKQQQPPAPPMRLPMLRPGFGTRGQQRRLLTNHIRVSLHAKDDLVFHHYHVSVKYADGKKEQVKHEGVCRQVVDKLQETYASELAGKPFAYDGEEALFTVGSLPWKNNAFVVVVETAAASSSAKSSAGRLSPGSGGDGGSPVEESDMKRIRRPTQVKKYTVELSLAAKVPMAAITEALRGHETEHSMEALRVLDIILRQSAAKQGCLLVRQSFFHNTTSSFIDLGAGIMGCPGFHSSFRPTDGGLSLNVDVSTTMIVRPGPVINFLLSNQNINDPRRIDWGKAKRDLKNLRIKTTHTNSESKIIGLTEGTCYAETFPLKRRNSNASIDTVDVTVFDYFMNNWGMNLKESAHFPCLIVGKTKRPEYVPLELCHLVPLQRYKKALSTLQRSSLVEKSRQKPPQRMAALSDAMRVSGYNSLPMLKECQISIAQEFNQVNGRVLQAPQLMAGDDRALYARNGRWNFNNNRFVQPRKVGKWAVVNFSARCNVRDLVERLIQCANMKGIQVDREEHVFEERPQMRRETAAARVNDMFRQLVLRGKTSFILCILPERKNCDIYGPWKRMCLVEHGIVSQCLAPPTKITDQYLTNVLLKINAKLGGLNSQLQIEKSLAIPHVSSVPTIIFGMDVSHGSPGRADVPSVAAVVSSLEWPLISKYKASICTQPPRVEMVDSLFKPVSEEQGDRGLVRELLIDFYKSSGHKPQQIIIFRDGVSESQFNQVLNVELAQIIEACKLLYADLPKLTLIVAQKNHHTRFFLEGSDNNVPPGTVVDKGICHPRNYDFYMCAHAGMIGTTRPTHYHVLHDEIGFSTDDLQELVHSLSYVYQRSTTAISVVAPICYAHLAAAQVAQFVRLDDGSSEGADGAPPRAVPELPQLHGKVRHSMFFC